MLLLAKQDKHVHPSLADLELVFSKLDIKHRGLNAQTSSMILTDFYFGWCGVGCFCGEVGVGVCDAGGA